MAKRKAGRKPKDIKDKEAEMIGSEFRMGADLLAASLAIGDADKSIKPQDRFTAAEIAWQRLVNIARGESDSLAMDASKFIIERTYGKSPIKAEQQGDHTFTINIS